MTLAAIVARFDSERLLSKRLLQDKVLFDSIPEVIASLRTERFIKCYSPVMFNGKDLYYPLITPVSVLCLEMKTIGE